MMSPILLFLIKIEDPMVAQHLIIPFQKLFGLIKQKTPFINFSSSSEVIDSIKEEELASELASYSKDLTWVNMLSSTIKETLYRTIMGSICYYYPRIIEKYAMTQIYQSSSESNDLVVFEVNGESLMKNLDLSENNPIMNCTFTIYAPTVFSDIVCSHFKKIDFAKSLDIAINAEKIKKLSEETSDGSGGKSGEFFYLTTNRTLILKTTN